MHRILVNYPNGVNVEGDGYLGASLLFSGHRYLGRDHFCQWLSGLGTIYGRGI